MGNQMFQYAVGRALALKNGTGLVLDPFLLNIYPRPKTSAYVYRDFDLDLFNIEALKKESAWSGFLNRIQMPLKARAYIDHVRRLGAKAPADERHFQFDPAVLELKDGAYLSGYWQSYKYFETIEDVIRRDFSLKKPFSEKGSALKKEIESVSSVCVNVRRADFVGSSFHGTFDIEYYARGLAKIRESKTVDVVYVFSDDVAWCEENLKFPIKTVFVGHDYKGERFGEYLYLMAACRHFIIPNSTFAWWAAWLATGPDKVVVAPKRWFLKESIDTSDLIPESWVRI